MTTRILPTIGLPEPVIVKADSGSGLIVPYSIISYASSGSSSLALEESEWHPTEPQTNPLIVSVW